MLGKEPLIQTPKVKNTVRNQKVKGIFVQQKRFKRNSIFSRDTEARLHKNSNGTSGSSGENNLSDIDIKNHTMGREKVAVNLYEGDEGFVPRIKRYNPKTQKGIFSPQVSSRFSKKRKFSGNLTPKIRPENTLQVK